jgi:hypothetical protein
MTRNLPLNKFALASLLGVLLVASCGGSKSPGKRAGAGREVTAAIAGRLGGPTWSSASVPAGACALPVGGGLRTGAVRGLRNRVGSLAVVNVWTYSSAAAARAVFTRLDTARIAACLSRRYAPGHALTASVSLKSEHPPEVGNRSAAYHGRLQISLGAAASYLQGVFKDEAIAYWRLDEQRAPYAADLTGDGYAGRYSGNIELGVKGALVGDSDTAVSLDGRGHISLPALGLRGPFSLELWVKLPAARVQSGGYGALLGYDTAHRLLWGNDGRILAQFGRRNLFSTRRAAPGTWHQVVYVYDGRVERLFIDGGAAGSLRARDVVFELPFTVGIAGTTYPLNGSVDEVAVYKQALGPKEVLNHFALGLGAQVPKPFRSRTKAIRSALVQQGSTVSFVSFYPSINSKSEDALTAAVARQVLNRGTYTRAVTSQCLKGRGVAFGRITPNDGTFLAFRDFARGTTVRARLPDGDFVGLAFEKSSDRARGLVRLAGLPGFPKRMTSVGNVAFAFPKPPRSGVLRLLTSCLG